MTKPNLEPAPPLTADQTVEGMGADAWRFLRRLSERRAYLRAGRADIHGRRHCVAEIVSLRKVQFRVLMVARPSAALSWLRAGWIEPARRVPGEVAYFRISPAGRAACEAMTPDPLAEPHHPGIDRPERVSAWINREAKGTPRMRRGCPVRHYRPGREPPETATARSVGASS